MQQRKGGDSSYLVAVVVVIKQPQPGWRYPTCLFVPAFIVGIQGSAANDSSACVAILNPSRDAMRIPRGRWSDVYFTHAKIERPPPPPCGDYGDRSPAEWVVPRLLTKIYNDPIENRVSVATQSKAVTTTTIKIPAAAIILVKQRLGWRTPGMSFRPGIVGRGRKLSTTV